MIEATRDVQGMSVIFPTRQVVVVIFCLSTQWH